MDSWARYGGRPVGLCNGALIVLLGTRGVPVLVERVRTWRKVHLVCLLQNKKNDWRSASTMTWPNSRGVAVVGLGVKFVAMQMCCTECSGRMFLSRKRSSLVRWAGHVR